ncbi:MAG: dimethyl sulfoxide reductase anchor subunit [Coriobacteriaceae bacterium]|nr:dimethyl sulfoxide reductase anchor subunit [Coriobacteriaceae bacterium]
MEIQWSLVLFTVISGAGAWFFAFAMLQSLIRKAAEPSRLECIIAVIILAVGGLASITHLSHPDRVLNALQHPTSGIFIEATLIGICIVLIAIYFILLVRNAAPRARLLFGILAMIVCVVFSYECGNSYTMESRPAWMTFSLPLAYCGTAAAAGGGVLLLVKALTRPENYEPAPAGAGRWCRFIKVITKPSEGYEGSDIPFAGILAAIGGALGIIVTVIFMIATMSYVTQVQNALLFAILALVGSALVIVAGIIAYKAARNTAIALGVLAVVGGVAAATLVRIVMWIIGTPILNFFLVSLD